MENLLCNEVWFSDDIVAPDYQSCANKRHRFAESSICSVTSNEYSEEAFQVYMNKETTFMYRPHYFDRLINPNTSISIARSTAIHWFIQTRSRLNLCYGTISNAANYLDRFVSAVQFDGWNGWVIELVAVSCLSIACKFGETELPPFHQIQMQGLDHTFETGLIQRMEFSVLDVLDWRLNCTTPYNYAELMTWNIIKLLVKPHLVDHFMDRLYHLLLFALLDCKFLAYRASVIAVSAIKCLLEELSIPSEAYISRFKYFIHDDQKENMKKCEERLRCKLTSSLTFHDYPSSPVTVLTTMEKRVHISSGKIDFSLFNRNKKVKI